jgi:hypothetical protein
MIFAREGTWRLVEESVRLNAILNQKGGFLAMETAAFARAKAEYHGKYNQDARNRTHLDTGFQFFRSRVRD